MLLIDLEKKNLISPPNFLSNNTHYLCRMGSAAYGVSMDNSDLDIYGVCIPPKDYIFSKNYIEGFDPPPLKFNVWQKHHVFDEQVNTKYEFSIYGIVNYFKLAMDNNPNVIDSLFIDREYIIHSTETWENVRKNKHIFLHKKAIKKMIGYAYSQLQKANNCRESLKEILQFEDDCEIPHSTTYEQAKNMNNRYYNKLWEDGFQKTSRFETQKIAGQDCKFLYHVFRLLDQAKYILKNCDLALQVDDRISMMKSIRQGEVSHEEIVSYFSKSEKEISSLMNESKLEELPSTKEIRSLLVSTLENHYGSLSSFVNSEDESTLAVREIKNVLSKYNI